MRGFLNFLPTRGFASKPLKVKVLAGEQVRNAQTASKHGTAEGATTNPRYCNCTLKGETIKPMYSVGILRVQVDQWNCRRKTLPRVKIEDVTETSNRPPGHLKPGSSAHTHTHTKTTTKNKRCPYRNVLPEFCSWTFVTFGVTTLVANQAV